MNNISPNTVLRLKKLWPHARKQGREIDQIYRVGYYCKDCGMDTIWLVDENGEYSWTVDIEFINKFFEIIKLSKERSYFGKGKPKITPLTKAEIDKLLNKEKNSI